MKVSIAEREFLNKKEMAAWLSMSENTLDNLVKEGLPIYRWSRKVYFLKDDVKEFFRKNYMLVNED
ncbi:helix-turn-helix domain-containing protein [Anaerococcus sp. Marseille-P3915]|uniref:helix-turn-helix domain-containing protein n=1 Tax=Anaerococcus sp. Marseille-P3915 TaxID=2057799 RepID=UPI000D0AFB91|nr:helix-turn-helix domain-containing protein [Anaerococcus sp. Marseille-P3915]